MKPAVFLRVGFAVLLFGFPCLHAEPAARTISDVLSNVARREKVVVQGSLKRGFDFDTYLLSDASGELAVSFVGVKQDLKAGDAVTVYGRFDGRSSYKATYGLINVLQWAKSGSPEAQKLVSKFGSEPAAVASETETPKAAPTAQPVAPARTVETRLHELDELKNKGLITADEYASQRKRILDDL